MIANLIRYVFWLNAMTRNVVPVIAHDMDPSAGDAGGNPDTLESLLLPWFVAPHAATRVADVKER